MPAYLDRLMAGVQMPHACSRACWLLSGGHTDDVEPGLPEPECFIPHDSPSIASDKPVEVRDRALSSELPCAPLTAQVILELPATQLKSEVERTWDTLISIKAISPKSDEFIGGAHDGDLHSRSDSPASIGAPCSCHEDDEGSDDMAESITSSLASVPSRNSRSEKALEIFLRSTLVEGGGLLLMKHNSNGGGLSKRRERIMSYDPQRQKVCWVSTGFFRKASGVYAENIHDVLWEGKLVTMICSSGAQAGSAASRGPGSQQRREKVFETRKERDAQILGQILLLIRRKFHGTETGTTTPASVCTSHAVVTRRRRVYGKHDRGSAL